MFSLDISKETLACCLLDPKSRAVVWETEVPNTPEGVSELLRQVDPSVAWVMEPTGRYSLAVAKQARAAGRRVLSAPPREAKQVLAGLNPRAKTDRLDARGIGQFALATNLASYPIKSEAVERLHQLLKARKGVSRSIASLHQRIEELPYAASHLEKAVAGLKHQLEELDRQIAAECRHYPEVQRLRRVPGIGPVTAAALAACFNAKQFSHPDQFVSYLGLDVRVRQSGKRQSQQRLTKRGDAELRRLLYLCAQASLRTKGSPFREQYEREKAKGLATTAALCAVSRKIARLCWSLVQHGTDYDPKRVYSQPGS